MAAPLDFVGWSYLAYAQLVHVATYPAANSGVLVLEGRANLAADLEYFLTRLRELVYLLRGPGSMSRSPVLTSR